MNQAPRALYRIWDNPHEEPPATLRTPRNSVHIVFAAAWSPNQPRTAFNLVPGAADSLSGRGEAGKSTRNKVAGRRCAARLVWPTSTLQVRLRERGARCPVGRRIRVRCAPEWLVGAACAPLLLLLLLVVTAVFSSASNAQRNGSVELRPLLFSQRGSKGGGGGARWFRPFPSK